jgi:hypothetical protein
MINIREVIPLQVNSSNKKSITYRGELMKRKKLSISLMTILVIGLLVFTGGVFGVSPANAQYGTPAVTSATGHIGVASGTGGYEFTANADIQVTALGIWDHGNNGLFDVLHHEVGLWTPGGTLLGKVTIPLGTGALLIDGYRYVDLIPPVDLNTGQQYVIGASYCAAFGVNTCGLDALISALAIFTTDPNITINNGRFIGSLSNPTFFFPSLIRPTDNAAFGPNFLFTGGGAVDDGDGIDDDVDGRFDSGLGFIDESAFFSDNFTDQHKVGGTSFGTIVDRADLDVLVMDWPHPEGLWLGAVGGTGTVFIEMCDLPDSLIALTNGDETLETCSSLTTEVLSGPVEILLGADTVVTVFTGSIAKITDLGSGTYEIENVGTTGTVDVDEGGEMTTLGPGESLMTIGDSDDDGIPDPDDNCPDDANPGQENNDGDGEGDVCDDDDDNDGVDDNSDNCPLTANAGQEDFDGDGMGDACDSDDDGDGIGDGADICPSTVIPESVPTVLLKDNRYALTGQRNSDTVLTFDSQNKEIFDTQDTGGCSCEQIIDALGLGKGHVLYGCSKSAMKMWIETITP